MTRTCQTLRLLLGSLLLASGCAVADESEDSSTSDGNLEEAAVALPAACRSAEIVALSRPHSSARPAGEKFTYRVWFRRPASPELPTVVHIPGGPGTPSIGHDQAWVPPSYGLVTTDPRGVGCNQTAAADAREFYRTDELANDVVAAIDVLRTKGMGKFLLHGHSYGTVLATHVAHLLADPARPQPEAVILEGVLARAFTTEWMAASYVDEWSFQKATLSPAVRSALREPKPLGYDGKTWGNFFMVMTAQLGPDATQAAFQLLDPDAAGKAVPENIEKLQTLIDAFGKLEVSAGPSLTLQQQVACRELTSDLPADNVDVVLEGGEIVKAPDVGTLCEGFELERPFHVRDHLYPFRTYYFIGDHDTATPPWQGKLHFDTLATADRVEIVVEGAGHLPLMRHLAPCGPSLVEAVAAGQGFGDALAACGAPVDVRFGRAAP
ncbi:MAG: alpha/beta fold hydrolase [Labilithrix sp.]|nr:alpha/beta fold hydrolase [Labilithrix sp.]